jgi:NAD+ diphosphatase
MAYARSEEIRLDVNEIDEAQWFTREEVDAILNGTHSQGVSIPPDRTIANRLITFWLKHMNISKL